MKSKDKIKVALADDHVLLRRGLASLVKSFDQFIVVAEADDGIDLQQKIEANGVPDLVLLDINMPRMDGYETAKWLKKTYPLVKVVALSMYDSENSVIKMFKSGARGYVLKDCEPAELQMALMSVVNKGYYYSELVTGKLIHTINRMDEEEEELKSAVPLNEKELQFLKLACTELTYKEIADQMFLSPRTIDGYRDSLFEKLNLKTRVGLVMYAIKQGIVKI